MDADPLGGGAVAHAVLRMVRVAGCILGLAFAIALLSQHGERAHADALPAEGGTAPSDVMPLALVSPAVHAEDTTSVTFDVPAGRAVSIADSTVVAESALWAEPAVVSATATRRADREAAWSARPHHISEATRSAGPPAPGTDIRPKRGFESASTALGHVGAGRSAPSDPGPSITQLAILSAVLMGVGWLSQRLRSRELWWHNTLLTLSIERPG